MHVAITSTAMHMLDWAIRPVVAFAPAAPAEICGWTLLGRGSLAVALRVDSSAGVSVAAALAEADCGA